MKMPGFSQQITFLHSNDLGITRDFYTKLLGLSLVRDQGTCLIFEITETAFLGFCQHITPVPEGRNVILTLISEDVDGWYQYLIDKGNKTLTPPKHNPEYHIYHFFLKDPDGFWIEIQKFDQPL